jgi:23S rRNA pseudouridine2605 synthase
MAMRQSGKKKTRNDQIRPRSRPDRTKSDDGNREPKRVNRILSLAGITSRRNADDLIKAGRITVNGSLVAEAGARAVWGSDSIKVDGKEIPGPRPRIYLMLNKPFGYVCTLKDPEGRRLVTELLDGITQRVYPAGRLDFDSLGLLLFTNDGELAYRLTHPSYQVPRTYKVTVAGRITDQAIERLKKGVELSDGPSGESKASVIKHNKETSIVRMTITQGRSRQVRRMIEAVGYGVVQLTRTGFGTLMLGDLKIGKYRLLENEEIRSLKRLVSLI